MWLYLSIVSLLFRSIIGYSENDHTSILDMGRPRNGNIEVLNDQDERTDPSVTISTGLRESEDLDNTMNEPNTVYDRAAESTRQIVTKRKDLESWLDTISEDKEFQEYVLRKANPWLYRWADRRLKFYRPVSKLHRPIQKTFDKYGGKRAGYIEANMDDPVKRMKLLCDQDSTMNGCSMKRVPPICDDDCKFRFYSWGGKRSDRSDFDKFLHRIEGIDKQEEDSMERRNKMRAAYDNWLRKNQLFYKIAEFPLMNESSEDVLDNGISDNDWLTQREEKRYGQGKLKKTKFYPWGGKKDLKGTPFETPAFFHWGG